MQIKTVAVDSQDIRKELSERGRMELHRLSGEKEGAKEPVMRAATSETKTIDAEQGTIDFMITTPDVDAWGDIVVPTGMDNSRFRKNPVVQWNHDYWSPPVARSLREEASDAGVSATAMFARDVSEFAAQIFNLYVGKFLNAVSIGFWPLKMEKRYEEREDGGSSFIGYEFLEWRLLEYSPVPIPANENALVMAANGIVRVARDLGMDREKRDGLGALAAAHDLMRRYPELLEKDGLQNLVRRSIEDVLAERDGGSTEADRQRRNVAREEALDILRETTKRLRAS